MDKQFWKIVVVMALAAIPVVHAASETTGRLSLVRSALNNYINYDICWGGGGKRRGSPYYFGRTTKLSLVFSASGTKFYVWGNTLQYESFAPYHPPIDDRLFGAILGEKAAIIGMGGPRSKLPMGLSLGSIIKFDYTIPTKCKMAFPRSRRKTQMVDALVMSITKFIKEAQRLDAPYAYHSPVHIVIANFDVYYPETFFYIKQTHEVYAVNLQNCDDYFSDCFVTQGFLFDLVNDFSPDSPLVQKIMKYGISKTITVPQSGSHPSSRKESKVQTRS